MDNVLKILKKLSNTKPVDKKIEVLKDIEGVTKNVLMYILNVTYDFYKTFNVDDAFLKKLKKSKNFGSGARINIDRFVIFLECQINKTECSSDELNELIDILFELRKDIANCCFNILKKDLKIDMTVKDINKAIPNLISEFKVQSYIFIDDIPEDKFLVCPMLGGLRCLAIPRNNSYFLFSENGEKLIFPEITDVLNKYCRKTNLIFDGEITDSLKYNIVDSIYFNEWVDVKNAKEPLYKRYNRLLDILSSFNSDLIELVPHVFMDDEKSILDFYKYCLEEGFNGIVLKKLSSLYEKKKLWFEKRPTKIFNLVVVSCNEGIGKKAGILGSFSVNFNGIIVDISGMKPGQRKEFWEIKEKLLGATIEIEADDVEKDGSLKFPRFKSLLLYQKKR